MTLNRVNPEIAGCVGDTSVALSILADDNNFFEVKAGYAKNMVTGFLRLDGVTVGAVANRSEICDEEGKVAEKLDAVLTAEGCEKAAEFVNFCDAFGIPVLTLTNVKGYDPFTLKSWIEYSGLSSHKPSSTFILSSFVNASFEAIGSICMVAKQLYLFSSCFSVRSIAS